MKTASQPNTSQLLKIKTKFIMIKTIKKEKKLCAVDLQDAHNKAPLVYIHTDGGKTAFQFVHRNVMYWVTAKGNKLDFAKDGEYKAIWFEKEDLRTKEGSGLRFEHDKTTLYLSANAAEGNAQVLTFTDKSFKCAPIKFENRN